MLLYIYLFIINVIAFMLYGLDKHNAVYHKWRYPEIFLLALAIFGGAYGAGMGMLLFRHKTRHISFILTVSISFVVWMVLLAIISSLK